MNAISHPLELPRETMVTRVAIENVAAVWPQVEPMAISALRGIVTHTADDVRRRVLSNQATLWVQWSGPVEAFAVTEFVSYPAGLCLRVWLCGARKGNPLAIDRFSVALKEWAAANDCRWIEAVGRVGWTRIIPDVTIEGVVVRHTLEDMP